MKAILYAVLVPFAVLVFVANRHTLTGEFHNAARAIAAHHDARCRDERIPYCVESTLRGQDGYQHHPAGAGRPAVERRGVGTCCRPRIAGASRASTRPGTVET